LAISRAQIESLDERFCQSAFFRSLLFRMIEAAVQLKDSKVSTEFSIRVGEHSGV
jgi:hypothetical protein